MAGSGGAGTVQVRRGTWRKRKEALLPLTHFHIPDAAASSLVPNFTEVRVAVRCTFKFIGALYFVLTLV